MVDITASTFIAGSVEKLGCLGIWQEAYAQAHSHVEKAQSHKEEQLEGEAGGGGWGG